MQRPSPEQMEGRTAYYFGTFDPVHLGHWVLAQAAVDQFSLERVVWVPTGCPPHRPEKQPKASARDRLAMIEAMLQQAGDPRFSVSDWECDSFGPHYTAQTLDQITKGQWLQGPTPSIALIVGADAWQSLPSWHRAKDLLTHAVFLIAPRPDGSSPSDFGPSTLEGFPLVSAFAIETPPWALSATWLRERLSQGKPISAYLPPGVETVIRARDLYAAGQAL